MKKAIIILLTALVALSVFVSCNQDSFLDEEFNEYVTVTFDSNNGSGATATQTIMKKTPTALDANGFKYAEHAFVCWNTKADGAGDTYTDTQEVKLEESISLYAQWSEVYTITEGTTIFVPGKAYSTAGEETIVSERIVISDADIIEEGGSTSRDAIIKEERKPVTIFLERGTTLIVEKGIEVAEGQELNIQGSGTLIATAGEGAAGIGGGPNTNAGTIVISGGTITTTGGTFAAGIGGGKSGNGGIVSVSGGDVTAIGGLSGGAGIGGGTNGDGAKVSITGGSVMAFGSKESVTVQAGTGFGAGVGGSSDGTLEIGEGLGLYGGKDFEDKEFISGPTDSYVGESFEFMGVRKTEMVTITFDANGGEGEMASQYAPVGFPVTLEANIYEKTDQFFDEWNTAKDGSGTSYDDMASLTTDTEVTLYAQWTDVPPFVYLDSNTTVLEDGNYYTITDDLELKNRLVVEGNAKIYLPDGKTLTAQKGITVSKGNALEICAYGSEGTGKLVATGASDGDAGIGGTVEPSLSSAKGAGTIIIKGGVIEATGSNHGAGIGGAEGGTGGRITITGGTVTAHGGDCAAGIGGGSNGSGVRIVISGGTVDAYAGQYAAAIGGGYQHDGGRITISGGTVTATGYDSVGIGSGSGCSSEGIMTIGSGIGLYGGPDKDSAAFLSAPTDLYEGKRPLYMETKATEYAVVTFKPNGGKETEDKTQEIPKGIDLALEGNTFTHATLNFDNWNTKADASGTAYADKEVVNIDKDLTLFAHWVEDIPLDDSFGGPDGKKLKSGKSYTITEDMEITGRLMIEGRKPVTIILPKDKTLTLSKGLTVTDKQNLVIEGEGTLIAKAGANSGDAAIGGESGNDAGIITINGGTVIATGSEGAVGIGAGQGGSSDGTLKIGEGMGLYGGADKASATFISFPVEEYEGERYVFMEAKPTEYETITFDANGGTGTMEDQIVPKSIAMALNANAFKHPTLNFAGWATTPKGAKAYGNKAKIEIDSNITLYAIWLPVIPLDDSYGGATGKKLEGGKKYTIDANLTIAGRLYIDDTKGAVTIILPEEGTLTLSSGLNVAEGQSLIIEGEGSLIAKAVSSGDAGIGGSKGASGGTITIKGGTVTATGAGGTGIDGGGAGIGGGHNGSGGTVIISGGTVTATGGGAGELGGGGAGIGSGHNPGSLGSVSGGTITISGGTVNATGGATSNGRGGAGLGGGNYADGADVSITGGTVTATAAPGTVGIGAGKDSTKHGSLEIGDGMGLYGGADKASSTFISAPTDSYTGTRTAYMETKATTYVTVTFDANGGTGTMDAQSVPKDFDVALNANVFEKTDMYFAGWNTKNDGSGDSYSDKGQINFDSDTTLFAQWTDGIPLDDSYGGEEGKKLEGGQKYTILEDLTIAGRLEISGLSNVTIVLPKDKTLTLSEGISVIAGQGLTIEGKGSLVATGSADCAAIGGINANAGGTVTINGGIITATGDSKAAGIGRGYGGDSDGTLKIGDGMGLYGGTNKDSAVFISAPVDSYAGTRYAYMTAKATTSYVTLTFNANGGSGTMEAQSVPSGENAYLSDNKFESTNTFVGWALTSDGDVAYSNQGIINVKANTTLYAKWIADVVTLTGGETTLEGGKNYTISDNTPFSVRLSLDTTSDDSPVTLVLPKDKTLTLNKGISVLSGQTLIIMGEGKLIANAESGSGNAAIGATKGVAGGDVKIYGGIITATGAYRGAGIGGGDTGEIYWEKKNKSGNIYIYGGKVTATGGTEAAGIGSGDYGETQTIVISGGEVTAQGGIGDGYQSSGANVTITGGIVKAVDYPSGISGSLKIGDGLALFGGGSKDSAVFLSGPVASYSGSRYTYMETKAADLVTITFNANGGTGTMPDQKAASGYAVKLNANAFTNGDWYFGGWALSDKGDIEYENKASITVDANTTLYAKWVDAIPIFSTTTVLDGGKKYTIVKDLTNNNRLSINGTEAAIIDLPEGMTLTLPNGINVPEGKSLTIQGKGTLTATGDEYNAGIGGNEKQTAGTITIKGGFVNATGSKWGGAGIGGGGGVEPKEGGNGGTITIEGGTVTASGNYGGAGIGGGRCAENGGTITISGGSVTATGGDYAAGIGGGHEGGSGGTISISGDDTVVTATGGGHISGGGAGIGGGSGSAAQPGGAGGTINISGGIVTATGGDHCAGIGGGSGTAAKPGGAGGTINISGGTVTATGSTKAAGIGGGGSFDDTKGGEGGTVKITGGTVRATGGSRGIGKGTGKSGTVAFDGELTIGSDMGLYGGPNQSKSEFLTKPTNSWKDDEDHRPAFMEAKPTDYVTITYNGNGGTGEMSSDLMVKDFAFYDLTANKFTTPTEGLIFTGWATSSDGDVVYSDEGTIAFSKDVTLYAKWGTQVVITESLKKLVAGHEHIHYGDVTNNNRLYITGGDSATIILTEGKTLDLKKGINVPLNKTLTIDGKGALIATGADHDAGIGGNIAEAAGTIIINGGNITATGHGDQFGSSGAGIGGGGRVSSRSGGAGGNVKISGENTVVTANGGYGAAGIGGGGGGGLYNGGVGGTITINDGTVTATGNGGAAGIGAGAEAVTDSYHPYVVTVTINGGMVKAQGGDQGGAGIGGRKDGYGGNVIITGGTVIATGGRPDNPGMGIGGGARTYGSEPIDHGKLAIGVNTLPAESNKINIAGGWSFTYGTKSYTATADVELDYSSYKDKSMEVTAPTT